MACEAMVGGGAGKGLRTRGCLYQYYVCLTNLLPLTLVTVLDPLAAHHGLILACHEGGDDVGEGRVGMA